MKKIKSTLRLVGLAVLIVLACCGVGFLGPLFRARRDFDSKPIYAERKDENSSEAVAPKSQE